MVYMKTKFEVFLEMFVLFVSLCAVILATPSNGRDPLILLNSVLVNWLVFKRVFG